MGFAELEKSVLEKARAEAKAITDGASKQAKAIIAEAEEKAKERKIEAQQKTKELCEQMEKKEIASGRLEAKKLLLLSRKAQIDMVFESLDLEKALSKAERKKILESLKKKAQGEIDVGKLYVSETDKDLVPGARPRPIMGGLIAESKDGTTMVDYSFDTMLEEIKSKHIAEMTGILFGK
jgi:vacuolar-type H+-ATPase subunit E/Vma4